MDCSRIRHKTVIDWVEFEINTATPTNFMTVQRVLNALLGLPEGTKQSVTGLGAESDRATTIFRFRIQDPTRYADIKAVFAGLEERFPFRLPPRVTAIEVAFDTYGTGASARQLAEIVTDRYRFSTAAPSRNWHFYRMPNEGRHYVGDLKLSEVVNLFKDGWQLTDNGKDADIRLHLYVKTWNEGATLNDPTKHRARFEATLQGAALPFTTLAGLESFDFASLSHLFKFRTFKDASPHPAVAYARQWSAGQHGLGWTRPRYHDGRIVGTSEFKRWTVADTLLNDAIKRKLRGLTASWRK